MRVEDQVVRYAEIGGRQVAWTAVGRGPALVMGGWWSSHLTLDWADEAFRSFVSALAAHHTVVRYDRPGSGRSDRRGPVPETLTGELDVLTGLLDHLTAEVPEVVGGEVSLLGASAGCAVAAAYAAEHPDRVSRLVLYGAYARGEDIASPQARATLLSVVEQLLLSPHTVHRHVANARTKLGVPTRSAAAAWALTNHDG